MTRSPMPSLLPDPDRHAAFYDGTAARRALAFVLDTVMTAALAVLLVPLTGFVALFVFPAFLAVVNVLWRAGFLARSGATPGMWLAGIELRGPDGARPDGMTAVLHTGMFVLSWAMVVPQLISVMLMLTSARGQGLADHVLGTAVINRPSGG